MNTQIKLHVLPGGKIPERKTEGAIGYDVFLRVVVSPTETDPKNPNLRKILFDFNNVPADPDIARHVLEINNDLVYRMDPQESVLIGAGFVTEMPFPMFYWVAPRSGLASRWGIQVTNAPGTVDPDYRGEAGVLVFNRRNTAFDLRHDMRIAQIVFQRAIIPEIEIVESLESLERTDRGSGGFGSTGLRG
ncbi:MAG: dUTP diphosphatase [Patescibacteria group bacterium]